MVAPIRAHGACQTVGVPTTPDRRARLASARLYFVADRGGPAPPPASARRGGPRLAPPRCTTAPRRVVGAAPPSRHASANVPAARWFAMGGLDQPTVGAVVAAGAARAVVVGAIAHAADPEAVTRELRAALERAPVGAGHGAA